MNLNFLIKKNHIFKRRKKKTPIYLNNLKFSTGIYNLTQIRFEFIYLKVFKKIFRKKYIKKKCIQKNTNF